MSQADPTLMMYYDEYSEIPQEAVVALLEESELGRLVTVGADGSPHIGLYPFVFEEGAIELHFNCADEQFADLVAQPRCVFEVDDVLGVIPSFWVDPENAVMATAYHRAAIFDCTATISQAPGVLAAQQTKLMARYQPEGGFRQLDAEDDLYRGMLGVIASIRLVVERQRVKFTLGQNRTREQRSAIVQELRQRGRRCDARAADALQWTLDREGPVPVADGD